MTGEAWVAILGLEVGVTGLQCLPQQGRAWVPGETKIASMWASDCQISVPPS